MGKLVSEATAPEIATISAALNLVPQEWRIDVLLFINKLIAKHTAHTRLCPYQNNCRFQKHCWYKHQAPNTHNPYAPSPRFSLRNNVQRNGEFTLQGNSDTKTTTHDLSQTGTLFPSASTAPGPSIYRSQFSTPPPSAAPKVKKTSRASSPENSSRTQSNLITEANDNDQVICTSPTQKSASGIFASQENSTSSETSCSSGKSGSWTSVNNQRHRLSLRARRPSNQGEPNSTCKDCCKSFALTEATKNWYLTRDLHVPLRCEDCRLKRKQAAAQKDKKSTPAKIILYQSIPPTGKKWATGPTALAHHAISNITKSAVDPHNRDQETSTSHRTETSTTDAPDMEHDIQSQRSGSIGSNTPKTEADDLEKEETSSSRSTAKTSRSASFDEHESQVQDETTSNSSAPPSLQEDSSDTTECETPSIHDWHLKDPRLRQNLQTTSSSPHKATLLSALEYTNDQRKETIAYSARHADLLLRRFKFTLPK